MTTPAFSQTFAFDAATGLVKRAVGQAALTADAYVGTQFDQGAAAITDMVLVVNIEAIDVSGTDKTYRLRVVASNQANRSDGTVLTTLELGDASAFSSPETVDTAAGDRFVAYFRTEKDGREYRYIDLHLDVAGTSPTITFNAYMSKVI
jgi:hypothetical protein